MTKLDVKIANNYPPLTLESPPSTPDEQAALEAAESIRAWIAENYGLEQLAIMDQYVRACRALGITDTETARQVHVAIESALGYFMLRGFQTGKAPTPNDIKTALASIAEGARAIARGLSLLQQTRRGVGLDNHDRANELKRLHRNVVLGRRLISAQPQSY